MRKISLAALSAMLAFALIGCNLWPTSNVTPGDSGNDDLRLTGVSWKLVGTVDAETGSLREFEPENCDWCYRLTFDTDTSLSGRSSVNSIYGTYVVDYATGSFNITGLGGTAVGAIWSDERLWYDILYKIETFSLQENELRLYYDGNKNYLLFRSQPTRHDQISLNLSKKGNSDPAQLNGIWDCVRFAYTPDGNTISDVSATPRAEFTIPAAEDSDRWRLRYVNDYFYEYSFSSSFLSDNLLKLYNHGSATHVTPTPTPEEYEILPPFGSAYSFVVIGNELIIYFTGDEDKNLLILKKKTPDVDSGLTGTSWKLMGIVDIKTGSLTKLEPKDREEYYTLTFNTDTTIYSYSTINQIFGNYNVNYETRGINITGLWGSEAREAGEGELWWDIL